MTPEKSEPNAQNSEINAEAHPSGARIQKLMENADREEGKSARERDSARDSALGPDSETGDRGETLRPSEREDSVLSERGEPGISTTTEPRPASPPTHDVSESRYISPEDPAEGAREESPSAPHRMDADNREER